jgi:hypothetical protein
MHAIYKTFAFILEVLLGLCGRFEGTAFNVTCIYLKAYFFEL